MSRIRPAIVSRNVIVQTPEKIGGQNEHAAIVTRVHEDNVIDVTMFPAGGDCYPVLAVRHVDSPHAGKITWRWPSGA
jgi:hypothetical protein